MPEIQHKLLAQAGFVRLWLLVYFCNLFRPSYHRLSLLTALPVPRFTWLFFFKTLAECDTLSALLLLSFFTIGEQPSIEEVHLSRFISHPWELIGGFGKFVLPRWERSLLQQDSALWHPAHQLDSTSFSSAGSSFPSALMLSRHRQSAVSEVLGRENDYLHHSYNHWEQNQTLRSAESEGSHLILGEIKSDVLLKDQ